MFSMYVFSYLDASAFLKTAHKILIQNRLLKHIYQVLPSLGETFGQKRQELAEAAKIYADVTVTKKGMISKC